MASSLRKAQVPIRARGSNKCPHHAGKEVIFACEDCGDLICSKCVSTLHRKHAVDDISEIIPQVKVTIQDFVKKAENRYIPEINGELKNLADKISRNKNHFKHVISRIVKQNESLKLELDKITNNLIALCREAENENNNILKKHRTELQSKIEELNAQILELKDTLQSGTNTQVYDTSKEIPSGVAIPVLPSVQEMDFKPTSILIEQLEELEELVGELFKTTCDHRTHIKSSVVPDLQRADIERGNEKEKYKKKTQPQISAKKYHSSDKPSKSNVKSFKNFYRFEVGRITSMRATSNNEVWVDDSSGLKLVNNKGKTQKTFLMEIRVADFCVSPSTADIWFCGYYDNSVRKVTGDSKSTVMFHTDSKPISIRISADGNILVGMRRQIVKYTQRGQILCKSIQVKQVPVVRCPDVISPCPVTRNVAVLDSDSKTCGGDGKTHVSILSEDLQLLSWYYRPDKELFCPFDVCYSDTGDIYFADHYNASIQRISGTGEFIETVYKDSNKFAHNLCVQSNGDIWAVFGGTSVIILQKQ